MNAIAAPPHHAFGGGLLLLAVLVLAVLVLGAVRLTGRRRTGGARTEPPPRPVPPPGPPSSGRPAAPPRPRGAGWAVETGGLTKRFGSNVAVNGVELQVPRGSAFGYLGPNGAGKPVTDCDIHPAGRRQARSRRLDT
jgi:hypothetical protein